MINLTATLLFFFWCLLLLSSHNITIIIYLLHTLGLTSGSWECFDTMGYIPGISCPIKSKNQLFIVLAKKKVLDQKVPLQDLISQLLRSFLLTRVQEKAIRPSFQIKDFIFKQARFVRILNTVNKRVRPTCRGSPVHFFLILFLRVGHQFTQVVEAKISH